MVKVKVFCNDHRIKYLKCGEWLKVPTTVFGWCIRKEESSSQLTEKSILITTKIYPSDKNPNDTIMSAVLVSTFYNNLPENEKGKVDTIKIVIGDNLIKMHLRTYLMIKGHPNPSIFETIPSMMSACQATYEDSDEDEED